VTKTQQFSNAHSSKKTICGNSSQQDVYLSGLGFDLHTWKDWGLKITRTYVTEDWDLKIWWLGLGSLWLGLAVCLCLCLCLTCYISERNERNNLFSNATTKKVEAWCCYHGDVKFMVSLESNWTPEGRSLDQFRTNLHWTNTAVHFARLARDLKQMTFVLLVINCRQRNAVQFNRRILTAWISFDWQLAWNSHASMINQSTQLIEYNSHSGWLKKTNTHKFDIKLIKNNQIMDNA